MGGRGVGVTLQQHSLYRSGSQLPLRPWLLPQGGSALNWVLFGRLLLQSSWPTSWALYLTFCFPDLPECLNISPDKAAISGTAPCPGLFFPLPCRSSLLLGAPHLSFL